MPSTDQPEFTDHQVSQARAGTVTTFAFSEDELKYTVADKTSSSTFKTSYTALSRDHGFLVERNTWLMNVGLLWVALGVVLTGMHYFQAQKLVPSFWLFIGAGCAGWVWLRTIRYLKVPAENGTLLIIEDGMKAGILAELEARRTDQLLRWHDFIDANEDPARQRTRFNWLHEEGALDAEQLGERLGRLDRLVAPIPPAALPGDREPGTALN